MKTRSEIAIEALDEIASGMERKWGIDRLPRLVPSGLAQRFYAQLDKLNAEILEEATAGAANVEHEAGRMRNAWMALDAAAEAAGALPLDPRTLEARLPDGRLLVVTASREEAWSVAHADRAAVVWSMEEIARVLWKFEMVNDAKITFAGAAVTDCRPEPPKPPVVWSKGDPLPGEMLGAG